MGKSVNPGKRAALLIGLGLALSLAILFYFRGMDRDSSASQVSGILVKGFRVLAVSGLSDPPEFVVYRGDYIKFDPGPGGRVVLAIPALAIEETISSGLDQAPYFKMKQTGVFDVFIGETPGTLSVIEYTGARYQAVSARDAMSLITEVSPLVLDVRTPKEYARGRLEGATLLPVQDLQKRISELIPHKNSPILIYCATGNRSTVASKILIDAGFSEVYNLRHGIADWYKKRFPVVK